MSPSDSLKRLEALTAQPSAVQWFGGLFRRAHVQLTDTGEKFTVLHHGDTAQVLPGFEGDRPNFVVPLESENIANLARVFEDDDVSPYEEYRIVKFMLRPCLTAALAMPILASDALRSVLKVESHWQEALLDPDGREDEQLTAVHVNDQWIVVPGYHGVPQRRLVMRPTQALEFQRRLFDADERNSITGWLDLAGWYKGWRETVSVPV